MDGLFAAFGGFQNILFAAIVGTVTYFIANKNMTWAVIAAVVALVIGGVASNNNAPA